MALAEMFLTASCTQPALAKLKEGFLKTVRTQQANKRQSSEKMTHSNELKLETVDSVKQRQARFDKLSNAYKEQREVCPSLLEA